MSRGRFPLVSAGLVALGVAVSVAWVYATGGADSLRGLVRVRPALVAPLLAITLMHVAVRFVRWQYLLRRADVRVPARASLSIYLASLAGAATPAYVGEAVRAVFLRRAFGTPARTTLTVLVEERFLDVVALGLVGVATADAWGLRGGLAAIVAVATLLALAARSVARRAGVPADAVRRLSSPSVLLSALALSLVAWVPATLTVHLAGRALGVPIGVAEGMRVFSGATLLGGLTLMPAGLGATGSAAVLSLERLGVDVRSAILVVALFRLATSGLSLSIGAVFLLVELTRARRAAPAAPAADAHFDEIAGRYCEQYSPHVWKLLLDRKVSLIAAPLGSPPQAAGLGLDLGCGLGRQCVEMARRGYRVVGVDASRGLLREAARDGASVVNGSALALPFPDAAFDFVYAVGVLHHLPDPESQTAACREVARVLKPGGRFIVHETNTRNPLFRFYMGYVFPILKTIDEGTERWIEPRRWESAAPLRLAELRYFTFLPDWIPSRLLPAFLALERRLESSWLRPYAVHYMAVLKREPAAPDARGPGR